jgi:hypothetical protein
VYGVWLDVRGRRARGSDVTVSELIAQLRALEHQDAEVHIPRDLAFSDTSEVNEIQKGTATSGLLNPEPLTVSTYVLCTGWEGL